MNWIMSHEPLIRPTVSAGVFGVMAIWEVVAAHRELTAAKSKALVWQPGSYTN